MYTYVYIHTLQQTLQHTVQSHCSKVVNIQRRPLCCDTHCAMKGTARLRRPTLSWVCRLSTQRTSGLSWTKLTDKVREQ